MYTEFEIPKYTRGNGQMVDNDNDSLTTMQPSETVMKDVHAFDKLAHFNRERIPERVVHAKGAGAFGKFVVTNNLSQFTEADFLSRVGKETDVFARFSTVAGEKGSADTLRDPRGFAVKFYTNEGNYDIVGNATPVFFVRDAIKFPDFIHSQKRNPVTNLPDPNAVWDFFSLTPISMHQLTRLMTDNGTPDGFRHMDGFGNHTFMWYRGDKYVWVRYQWVSQQGIKNLTAAQAEKLAGTNPNYAVQDLYENIAKGNYPSWDLYVQMLTPEEAQNYRYDIFDVTKIIYPEDFPLIKVGRMTLNLLPENFFNEVEQASFCPGNIVRGINLSPDKMLNMRAVFYNDAARHRIGANFQSLKVNAPKSMPKNYMRDAPMASIPGGAPNYFPNSFGGPMPDPAITPPPITTMEGPVARHAMPVKPIDYEQPRRYYEELSATERNHLIENICAWLGQADKNIQYRQCAVFYLTSLDYATRVATVLNLNMNRVAYLAGLSEEERMAKTMPSKSM